MKKLNVILLILSFILSGIGSIFLFDVSFTESNNLTETNIPQNNVVNEDLEYTYKSYEESLIDYFNLPSSLLTTNEEDSSITIDYSAITRKKEGNNIVLSYDGNPFYTVTSDELIGTGTKNDPWIAKNRNGFLYLMNYNFSKLDIANRYIELGNDIYLNDEKFDKKGQPHGGDGTIYNYVCTRGWGNYSYIDGKNHTIYGYCGIQPNDLNEDFKCRLFGSARMTEIKNITVRDFYVNGKNSKISCTICTYIDYAENITIHEGMMETNGSMIGGICETIVSSAKYCNNYADIHTTKDAAFGIAQQVYIGCVLEYCNNYGDIYATTDYETGSRIGGLLRSSSKSSIIKNCNNYGNITSTRAQNGGLVAWGAGTFINCSNYGDMNADYTSGGFVGYVSENVNITFENCSNYGEVGAKSESTLGHFIGCVSYAKNNIGKIVIKNCYAKTNSAVPFVGFTNYISEIIISNCKADYNAVCYDHAYLLWSIKQSAAKLIVDNVEINVKDTKNNNLYLSLTNANGGEKTILKNIIINVKQGKIKSFARERIGDTTEIQSLIINQSEEKQYYGSDFSGYYFAWKTGKLGVVAIDGRGQFQGKIDEEWLAKKGYTKKEI